LDLPDIGCTVFVLSFLYFILHAVADITGANQTSRRMEVLAPGSACCACYRAFFWKETASAPLTVVAYVSA
jgi:hypothetical protein